MSIQALKVFHDGPHALPTVAATWRSQNAEVKCSEWSVVCRSELWGKQQARC